MKRCQVCAAPMVWSLEQNREWCSVYGDHRIEPGPLMLAADAEMQALNASCATRFKRKDRDDARVT